MNKEFSRLENLWVGEKKENQQKGSDAQAADKVLKKAKPGSPEYEAALVKRSAAMVDPAKGTANGKKIGTTEKAWINQINSANSRLSVYISVFNNGNLKPNSQDHSDARDDCNNTGVNQKRLGDFSKEMNKSEFNIINLTLQVAVRVIFELNRILKR